MKYIYNYKIEIPNRENNRVMTVIDNLQVDDKSRLSKNPVERIIYCIKKNKFPYASSYKLDNNEIQKVANGIKKLIQSTLDANIENIYITLDSIKFINSKGHPINLPIYIKQEFIHYYNLSSLSISKSAESKTKYINLTQLKSLQA